MLERRVAALEGGVEVSYVKSGRAAVSYAVQNVSELGSNIVSVPQLCGTTHLVCARAARPGVFARFPETDHAHAIAKLIPHSRWHGLASLIFLMPGTSCWRAKASTLAGTSILQVVAAVLAAAELENTWHASTTLLYAGWSQHLCVQKAARGPLFA